LTLEPSKLFYHSVNMDTEAAFKAAVNIIRSMPKNGPFQPSHELMLRFYGLFKQVNEGICNEPKPAFYAVVNKAKWDAWKSLGNMPKEEAMKNYVEELKQIVETMSFSEDVANFMHVLGPFYEIVYHGQEPENLRHNSSPHPSETEKDHQEDESGYSSSINGTGTEEAGGDLESGDLESGDLEVEKASSDSAISTEESESLSATDSLDSLYASEKFYSDAESDDDEYKDPLPDQSLHKPKQAMKKVVESSSSGEQLHVTMAIQRLQADLDTIQRRLDSLETQQQRTDSGTTSSSNDTPTHSSVEPFGTFSAVYNHLPSVVPVSTPSWFPFKQMNWATIAIILSWPVVAQYMVAKLRHRRPQ